MCLTANRFYTCWNCACLLGDRGCQLRMLQGGDKKSGISGHVSWTWRHRTSSKSMVLRWRLNGWSDRTPFFSIPNQVLGAYGCDLGGIPTTCTALLWEGTTCVI